MDTAVSRSGHKARGQALVEYATVIAMVGAGIVILLGLLGRATARAYEQTSANLAIESPPPYVGGGTSGGSSSGGGTVAFRPGRGAPHQVPPSRPADPADPDAPPDSTAAGLPDTTGSQVASQ